MLVKELYNQIKTEHDEIKLETEKEIYKQVQKAMNDFTKKTGCFITSISFEGLSHYSSREGLKSLDKVNVIRLTTTTDIEEGTTNDI